ncbi:hypothetical protein GGH19_005185 [Coemansia sp. RSA 1807]|nr:hypothetical protein GGH19_005185 [Coemansia sp. RSA 1807]
MPGNTLLLLVLLIVGALVSANGQQLPTRAPEDLIKQLKRGVLLKNKKLTSCELAPLDNGCSIVAASCLEYLPGTTELDMNFEYEVLLDDGIDGVSARYMVENINPHPYFSLKQLANNFAILQHNSGEPITWQNRIAPFSFYDWSTMVYSRAMITDVDNPDWSTSFNATIPTAELTCVNLSGLYYTWYNDMTCSPSLTTPPTSSLSNCQIPMGVAYSIAHDTAFIVGPYSYSEVVGGNSFCSYSYQRSYYTAINNYMAYIVYVVGRNFLVGDEIYQVEMESYYPEYDMIYPEDPAENPMHPVRLTGDFYNNQTNVAAQEPAFFLAPPTPYDSSTTSNEASVEENTSFIDTPITSSHSQTHIKCPSATLVV